MCFSLAGLRHELGGTVSGVQPLSSRPTIYGPNELAIILSTLHYFTGLNNKDFVSAVRDAGIVVGSGGAALVGVPLLGTLALTAAGFTGTGIAAGSAAAAIQSSIGAVAAGSWFATIQSIGATGGLAILGPVGLAAGVVGGSIAVGGIFAYKHFKKKKKPYYVLIYLHV